MLETISRCYICGLFDNNDIMSYSELEFEAKNKFKNYAELNNYTKSFTISAE